MNARHYTARTEASGLRPTRPRYMARRRAPLALAASRRPDEDLRRHTRRTASATGCSSTPSGQTLGRLATQIADMLRGKRKPTYTPHIDTGDFVVVVNAEKIAVTGNKRAEKLYYRHSGYPGGLRSRTLNEMLERRPEEVIRLAVQGHAARATASPASSSPSSRSTPGPEHPHAAQKPQPMEIDDLMADDEERPSRRGREPEATARRGRRRRRGGPDRAEEPRQATAEEPAAEEPAEQRTAEAEEPAGRGRARRAPTRPRRPRRAERRPAEERRGRARPTPRASSRRSPAPTSRSTSSARARTPLRASRRTRTTSDAAAAEATPTRTSRPADRRRRDRPRRRRALHARPASARPPSPA